MKNEGQLSVTCKNGENRIVERAYIYAMEELLWKRSK